jgi:hypothetical protein
LIETLDLQRIMPPSLGLPPHIRDQRKRNLTDAEIDISLECLEGARDIYAPSKSGARLRTAEHRLWCTLAAMKGRVADDEAYFTPVMGKLVQPEPDYVITQRLLDLYSESVGRACRSVDDLVGWCNSNRGSVAIQNACNRS